MAALRVHLTYAWRHGRIGNFKDPQRFTEWVQWRKLNDRHRLMPVFADKIAVKAHVSALLGERWITPTLWSGETLPEKVTWPKPFVVKSRHGCNQRAFVRTGSEDWTKICDKARTWMRSTYGIWLDEWAYRGIPRGLLAEPFLGDPSTLPVDYKLHVFGGRVAAVQVHLDRERAHRWILLTPQWERLSAPSSDPDPPPPVSLAAMIEAAETLGAPFDYVRADFYEIDGAPRFGELTFYPGSGLDPFDRDTVDLFLGRCWSRAIIER